MASAGTTKAEVRAVVRARRDARAESARLIAAEQLAHRAISLLPAEQVTVSAYQSMAAEPGTAPLIAALLARGDQVLLPRIVGRQLEFVQVGPDSEYRRGPLGIQEPVGPALDGPTALAGADVLFLPGLAVDRTGRRLGQGGGYYDGTLANVPVLAQGGPLRVAVLFDEEFVDVVPSEDHDCSVDVVLTPGGITRLTV